MRKEYTKGLTHELRVMKPGDSFLIYEDEAKPLYGLARQIGVYIKTKKEGNAIRVWKL